jgi:predicted ester cyclase
MVDDGLAGDGRSRWEALSPGRSGVQLCQGWREALPDVAGEVTAAVQEGDLAALQIHWTGTHGGTLYGPGLELPATGKPIEADAGMWVRATNGRARELRHHLDVLTLLKQVGAL